MNLFFKSYRNCLIFFLLITWEPCFNCGMAQESSSYLTPWIQEIKLPSQYSDIPNKSIYLDHLGHLFIGKENGLSIFDGNSSIHLQMNGPVFVTGQRSDTLFYAAENDIGYLILDNRMEFHTVSRKHWIPASLRTFIPSGLVCHALSSFDASAMRPDSDVLSALRSSTTITSQTNDTDLARC